MELILDSIIQYILLPALMIIGGAILLVVKKYAEKITDSILRKNEIEESDLRNKVKSNIITEIDNIIQTIIYCRSEEIMGLPDKYSEDCKQWDLLILDIYRELVNYIIIPSKVIQHNSYFKHFHEVDGSFTINKLIKLLIKKRILIIKSRMVEFKLK